MRPLAAHGAVVMLAFALSWGHPRHAGAKSDPARRFAEAEKSYEGGAYRKVIALLRPLLYPQNQLPTKSVFIRAHKMLAISYVFEKQELAAEQSFLAILAERPTFQLDAMVDPAAALKLIERVRQRSAQMLRKIEAAQRREEEQRKEARKRREAELARLKRLAAKGGEIIERTRHKRHYWLNFLPFGVGQFQNEHRVKGRILLATQLALGAASLGFALGHRIAYPGGVVTQDQQSTANAIRTSQVISGMLFWLAVSYGIVDALLYFRGDSIEERRYPRQLSLAPVFSDGGAGLTLGLTF